MSRKDMIIVAVLVNTGLLAILFMMAVTSDDSSVTDQPEIQRIVAEAAPVSVVATPPPPVIQGPISMPAPVATNVSSHDELDTVIKEYSANVPPTPVVIHEDLLRDAPPPVPLNVIQEQAPVIAKPVEAGPKTVDVTVKRGDSLDKIARANNTSIKSIVAANNLGNDKLKIGQVLHVPVGNTAKSLAKKVEKATESKPKAKAAPAKVGEGEYYTLKNGDNPWKIAKQFKVKFEDLLKLNNLDEEKARRMKAGDKIRVK